MLRLMTIGLQVYFDRHLAAHMSDDGERFLAECEHPADKTFALRIGRTALCVRILRAFAS